MLTKQLKVLIETSLAQGQQYEDIKGMLSLQGFEDTDIEALFNEYKSQAVSPIAQPVAQSAQSQPASQVPPQPQSQPQAELANESDVAIDTESNQATAPDVSKEERQQEYLADENLEDIEIIGDEFVPSTEQQTPPAAQSAQSQPTSSLESSTMGSDFLGGSSSVQSQTQGRPQVLDTPYSVPISKTSTPPIANANQFSAPVQTPPVNPIVVGIGGPEISHIQAQAAIEDQHKSIVPLLIILIVVLAAISGFLFWYYVLSDFGKESAAERAMLGSEEETVQQVDPATVNPFTGEPVE